MFTGGNAVPTARGKRGQGHQMVPLPPLDSPKTLLCAATPCGRAAKREKRELGSVRRAAFGTLLYPEVSLRYPPRITVRGHSVQGGSVPLRKAPLPSRVYPWSTKRPCGPLAFRRATEGSRVLRKGWGVKRGRETLVSLPLLPPPPGGGIPLRRETPAIPSAVGTAFPLSACGGRPPERREGIPSAERKSERRRQPFRQQWRFSLYLTKKPPWRSLFSLKFRLHY